tara:strand:+ start:296 stop:430 length:135 start_codon:yes stop_codon:yes gene_type:complete
VIPFFDAGPGIEIIPHPHFLNRPLLGEYADCKQRRNTDAAIASS